MRLRKRNQNARKRPTPFQAHQAPFRGLTPVPLGTDADSATRGGWRRSNRRHGGEKHGEGVGDRAPQGRRHHRGRIDGNSEKDSRSRLSDRRCIDKGTTGVPVKNRAERHQDPPKAVGHRVRLYGGPKARMPLGDRGARRAASDNRSEGSAEQRLRFERDESATPRPSGDVVKRDDRSGERPRIICKNRRFEERKSQRRCGIANKTFRRADTCNFPACVVDALPVNGSHGRGEAGARFEDRLLVGNRKGNRAGNQLGGGRPVPSGFFDGGEEQLNFRFRNKRFRRTPHRKIRGPPPRFRRGGTWGRLRISARGQRRKARPCNPAGGKRKTGVLAGRREISTLEKQTRKLKLGRRFNCRKSKSLSYMKRICEVFQCGCPPPASTPNGTTQYESAADQGRVGAGILGHVEDRLHQRKERLKRGRLSGARRQEEERAERRFCGARGDRAAIENTARRGKEIFAFLDDMASRNTL